MKECLGQPSTPPIVRPFLKVFERVTIPLSFSAFEINGGAAAIPVLYETVAGQKMFEQKMLPNNEKVTH